MVLRKYYDGNAYLTEYGFNEIGLVTSGMGYQIK